MTMTYLPPVTVPQSTLDALRERTDLSTPACQLLATRNMDPDHVWPAGSILPPSSLLPDLEPALDRLEAALAQGEVIAGVFDHDADGCTSAAVFHHAMVDHFGADPARMHLVTSHKLKEGYGLSEGLADRILALAPRPTLIVTGDQGSSDQAQIARLADNGIQTIVTDHHHVPKEGPPAAAVATVNPCRADSQYPDKAIAGCGVMWLVMSALRTRLAASGAMTDLPPNLAHLLDFVALGTTADAVSLASPLNRWFVQRGLALMAKQGRPCWAVMPEITESALKGGLTARDLSWTLGPLINASGRVDDAQEGIVFLTARDTDVAHTQLQVMRANNQARKELDQELTKQALELAQADVKVGQKGLVVFLPDGSPAVQGIVAARVVERFNRPTICLSPSPNKPGVLSGSVRSVPGFDVRDALETIDGAHPGLLTGFGGHTAAAGLTLPAENWVRLARAWHETILANGLVNERIIQIDLELRQPPDMALVKELVRLEPMGRGFEAPTFRAHVKVEKVAIYKGEHLCLTLRWGEHRELVRAMWFGQAERFNRQAGIYNADNPQLMVTLIGQLAPSVFRNQARCELTITAITNVVSLAPDPMAGLAMPPARRTPMPLA